MIKNSHYNIILILLNFVSILLHRKILRNRGNRVLKYNKMQLLNSNLVKYINLIIELKLIM